MFSLTPTLSRELLTVTCAGYRPAMTKGQAVSGIGYSSTKQGVAPQTETASDLVDDWETADVAMTFTQGSNTLDIPGSGQCG